MLTFKSALFLDYDNVRSELDRYDPAVAARFSNRTLLWLQALEAQEVEYAGEAYRRRIVSRRCYASPHMIEGYRRNFTQTGFEVVDCPPLTTQLKNSADIYIVMDVVDYLGRYPHIDEYIILSGDADFVPVLNRLRKELKRAVIYASYNTTAAYRNCSDQRIEAEFFQDSLLTDAAPPRPEPEPDPVDLGSRSVDAVPFSEDVETCLIAVAARRFGRVPFASAAQSLRDRFVAELGANWAGYGNFTHLLAATRLQRLTVDWERQELTDPEYELELPDWPEDLRDQLGGLVGDIAASATKHVPALRPHHYQLILRELAGVYRNGAPTFSEAIEMVTAACVAAGFETKPQEVRFIATGISMQGYRFDESATARLLAQLWRVQVFFLCGEPDWLREPGDALRFATWLRAPDETPEEARDDFLARTADEVEGG